MRVLRAVSLCVALFACHAQSAPLPGGMPQDGLDLLARMHARYSDSWYHTLTFVQKTVQRRPDGTEAVSTWYEAQSDDRLRIDMGDPSAGNGALYTSDSLYVVRGGKVVRASDTGNPFLPLISGVYIAPMATTVEHLAHYRLNFDAIYARDWEGRRTFVMGSRSAADTTSPQVWVDADRLIVTRFILPLFPSPDGRSQDVRLENNVEVGSGWLATRIRMFDKGVPVQTEDYSDWHTGVSLPASFFRAETWGQDPHWHRPVP
jgi:hypothetical protein